jgi:hypothetical protein
MSTFDIQYLKQLFDELNASNREQAKLLASLTVSTAEVAVTLRNIEKRNSEQDISLKEHGIKIHELERRHDTCDAKNQIKGLWKHIERLNAYMDLQRQEDSRYDTGAIDAHAQKLQHAAEISAMSSSGVSFRDAAVKMMPWMVLVFALGLTLATIIVIQLLTGVKVLPGQ